MSDESRVQQLLEEALESGRPPEEVCAEFPQLLWPVMERLRQCQSLEAQIDALFPPSSDGMAARRRRLISAGDDSLPQIPGYQVEAVLGRGGVGVVYRAKHLKLKRYVALKMLLSGAYADPHELARFTREAEAVASLRHCDIVQVYDVGEFDAKPYFTMEMMEGGSLARKLAGMPQPTAEAASLLVTLARATHAAHRGGVVHRDLKPSNILLTADGMPKISDFGLARHIAQDATMTVAAAHGGTPSYMAPEQALGKVSAIGPQTDVYGLGAILYELLTGRPPFRAESASETERQLLSREPVAPSRLNAKVPCDLETICLKCLRKEPEHRYPSAAALADDLRRFVEGRPIEARPPGLAGRLWRWVRRQPALAALVATGIALVVMAVGGGFWGQRQRAAARAVAAQQEQAIEAALAHADQLAKLGHWPEAQHALEGAPGLLGTSARADLRERLRRARADADIVNRLEDVRLRLAEGTPVQGRQSPVADRLYAEAFASYGITLASPAAANAAAAAVKVSRVRDILLAFLHDWLYWAPPGNRERLGALLNEADPDPWRRAFRKARAANDIGMLERLAHAPEAMAQPPAILSGLGGVLLFEGRAPVGRAVLRGAQHQHPDDFWINYLVGRYLEQDRPQEAVGYFRAAVAIRPGSGQAHTLLSRALQASGDSDGAAAALGSAIELTPSRTAILELAAVTAPKGRLEDSRSAWEKMLRRDPPDHESWYGYAQLCLYLGKDDEYRRTRAAMLRHFGKTSDWIIAERTSLACLLLPDAGDELGAAADLADRAVANARKSADPDNPYVMFVSGLADYRRGRFEQAIPVLREVAKGLPLRPAPRLVLAMAQYRSGAPSEARATLTDAVTWYNWQAYYDEPPTLWVSHVLRREAEALILPDLPGFLAGGYQPQDNPERLALQGVCQSRGLYRAAARLYADAFAADPDLGDRLTAQCRERASRESGGGQTQVLNVNPRYLAARCAAMAGLGLGHDAPAPGDPERARCRALAREWLRADMKAWGPSADDPNGLARQMLKLWEADADFAPVRDPDALKKLTPDEQREWSALWNDVGRAVHVPTVVPYSGRTPQTLPVKK